MIRILWICNIMLPAIAKERSLPYSNREGWLSGIFERLQQKKVQGKTDIELGVCFPVTDMDGMEHFFVRGVQCFGFYENMNTPEFYDEGLEHRFSVIYKEFEPDMIHIFGTEFPHALAAAKSFGRPQRTLVGIQGLCSEIEKMYMAGIPERVQKKVTFRDFVKKDSLRQQKHKFHLRGIRERELISLTGHITGRTAFDRDATHLMNPDASYHHMNETMRIEFYTGCWKLSECDQYRIFLGQGDYPLKGFHIALEALSIILKSYPKTVLYVGGNSIISRETLKDRLKLPAYGKYLIARIRELGLEEHVKSTGSLNAGQMKEMFLKTHVFICPSLLENSPNMVAEAMLLGVPVAASFTGGIPDMITDGVNGLLVPAGNADKLAEAVKKLFSEKKTDGKTMAEQFSQAERNRASKMHNGEDNFNNLLEIYHRISDQA